MSAGRSLAVSEVARMVGEVLHGHDVVAPERPGLLDDTRLRELSGWRPAHSFEEALRKTLLWYVQAPAR